MKPARVDAAPSRTKEVEDVPVEDVPVEDEADEDSEDSGEEADDDEDVEDENVSLSIQSEYLYSLTTTYVARTFTRAQRFSIRCGCHQFETKGIYLRLPQRNQSTQDLERTPQSS
jgi:hypothetical protein